MPQSSSGAASPKQHAPPATPASAALPRPSSSASSSSRSTTIRSRSPVVSVRSNRPLLQSSSPAPDSAAVLSSNETVPLSPVPRLQPRTQPLSSLADRQTANETDYSSASTFAEGPPPLPAATPTSKRRRSCWGSKSNESPYDRPNRPLPRFLRPVAEFFSRIAQSLAEKWKSYLSFWRTADYKSQNGLKALVDADQFHITVISLVAIDMISVFTDLILTMLSSCLPVNAANEYDPVNGTCNATFPPDSRAVNTAHTALSLLSFFLLLIFCVEIMVTFYATRLDFLRNVVRVVDALVVFGSMGWEIYTFVSKKDSDGSAGIVVLRMWRLIRAIHAVAHSVEMRNKSIRKAVKESNHAVITECVRQLRETKVHSSSLEALLSHIEKGDGEEVDHKLVAAGIDAIAAAVGSTVEKRATMESLGLALSLIMIQLCL
ncbi:hypothetical protein DFJ73DRAFT_856095 [Zopfochytrium polystomum]|nr:hypothetical protein DFJ73DRAFT_856095 [Zopfochytrium polystomum]